jgi:hypothetical protein
MNRTPVLWMMYLLVFLTLGDLAWAQQSNIFVPAGTLLRCTIDEPNLSPATAEIGDPVLCHLDTAQFGQGLPRGVYLTGRLIGAHQPGHLVGKGSMTIAFDRIGLPNSDLPLPGKIIAIGGYHVNRDGTLIGGGHAKRDAFEWMIPVLWPWKMLMLPRRGPQPALRGETRITLRVMEDVLGPQLTLSSNLSSVPRDYRRQGGDISSTATSVATRNATYSRVAPAPANSNSNSARKQGSNLTLLALRSGRVYAALDYWLRDTIWLDYVLVSGATASIDLNELDWALTTQLNAERGVMIKLRNSGPTL